MIYVDTSLVLAQLLAEDRRPPSELWAEELVSSRLLEYELWNHLNRSGWAATHGDAARLLLARLAWIELDGIVLERALRPFPLEVRTADALHLSSVGFLRERGRDVRVATYDPQLSEACRRLGVPLEVV